MKKLIKSFTSLMLIFTLASCSVSTDTSTVTGEDSAEASESTDTTSSDKPFSGHTLEIAERYTGATSEQFAKFVEGFEEETGADVVITEYGDDYESTMKTRMASNTLPDIFQTHGWSIGRYKEYLVDLQDEEWAKEYDEAGLGVVQDDDGAIYVLMTSLIANGTLVNLDVCEAAGVDPYTIETWDDLEVACEKVKSAGYTPIGSFKNPGNLANVAGTWTTYEGEVSQDGDAQKDGSYDFASFKPFLEKQATFYEKGYYYQDYATLKGSDATERWANNQAAFFLGNGTPFLLGALEVNPDGNYALIPTPASKEGGQMYVGIGEGETFGIWKDTEEMELAKAFLDYVARPENALAINSMAGSISALSSTKEIDNSYGLQLLNNLEDKYEGKNVRYENLWDREYMPNGMWSVFDSALGMLLGDYSEEGIDKVIEYLHENYVDLYETAQAN